MIQREQGLSDTVTGRLIIQCVFALVCIPPSLVVAATMCMFGALEWKTCVCVCVYICMCVCVGAQ